MLTKHSISSEPSIHLELEGTFAFAVHNRFIDDLWQMQVSLVQLLNKVEILDCDLQRDRLLVAFGRLFGVLVGQPHKHNNEDRS